MTGLHHASARFLLLEFNGASFPSPCVQVLPLPGPQPLAASHAALAPLRPIGSATTDPSEHKERKRDKKGKSLIAFRLRNMFNRDVMYSKRKKTEKKKKKPH